MKGLLPALMQQHCSVLVAPHQPRTHRVVVVAHLYDDTLRMLQALQHHSSLMELDAVVGIPYSSNGRSTSNGDLKVRFESGLKSGVTVHVPTGMDDFVQAVESSLDQALDRCRDSEQRLIVQDCGGTAVGLLHSRPDDRLEQVEGAVEITKRGLWKARELPLKFPVLHAADSRLKRMEAVRCGETVALCLDRLARADLGWSLAGRRAAVFGMGWIGSGVAQGLRNLGALIHRVIDTDPIKVMEAQLNGFPASDARDLGDERVAAALRECDVVVGASGRKSLTRAILERLRDGALVASASSAQAELDMDYLRDECAVMPVSHVIRGHRTPGGSTILLANDGFPVNFVPGSTSVPDEIVETILGELLLQMHQLASSSSNLSPGIYGVTEEQERVVANMWNSLRNDNDKDIPAASSQTAVAAAALRATPRRNNFLKEPLSKHIFTQARGYKTSTTSNKSTIAGAEFRNHVRSTYLVNRLLGQKLNLYGTAKFSVVGDYIRPIAADLDRPVRILDLGCSTSISKEYLHNTLGDSVDFEYCGVDYEAAFEPDIVMDITKIYSRRADLPWKPDVILLLDVLEHLPGKEKDIQTVVSQCTNLLPPHGMILAVVPQLYRLDRLKLSHLRYPEHTVRFTLDEWATIVRRGADISEIRGIGYISCLPYLPMLSPWYQDDNGHGRLFRYLRGTAFEWEPLKSVEVFLTYLLGSTVQGWCNSSLLVLRPEQNEGNS